MRVKSKQLINNLLTSFEKACLLIFQTFFLIYSSK